MEYDNEKDRHMAILEAALPYVAPTNRRAIELLLQSNSLLRLVRESPDHSLEAAEAPSMNTNNPQELLVHIQDFLTPKESDFVKTILNFMNANKIFQNYQEFAREQAANQGDDADLSAATLPSANNPLQILFSLINSLGTFGNLFSSNGMTEQTPQNNMLMEFMMSQLSPEQKATFEQFQNIMYNNGGNS